MPTKNKDIKETKVVAKIKKASVKSKSVSEAKKLTTKEASFSIPVISFDGKKSGSVVLPKEIFDVHVSPLLIAQVVRVYHANQRQGTAHTKTRGDVTGSGRKIYKQKGTGRARHGDRYAPIFVGGGVAHGPKSRDFSKKISISMRRKALFAVLSQKREEKNIIVVESSEKAPTKTQKMFTFLKTIDIPLKHGKLSESVLMATPGKTTNMYLSGRNIENVSVKEANLLHAYDVLNHKKLIISKEALDVLSKTFLKS